MARNWANLSPTYRGRLERAGVTKAYYEGGGKLGKARGHAHTPEHPEEAERNPEKYPKYRNNLVKKVIAKKKRVFGDQPRFHELHSRDYVIHGVAHLAGFEQRPPTIAELKEFLALSDNQLYAKASSAARGVELQYSALWYH